ncbi:MAG: helix-turn-helix domain-containing protein [Sulfobacillus sp.]
MTVQDAAQRVGKSIKTIRRAIQSGQIPAHLEPGPHGPQWIITEVDFARWTGIPEVEILPPEQGGHALDMGTHEILTVLSTQRDQIAEVLTRLAQMDEILRAQSEALKQLKGKKKRRWWTW